MVSRLPETMLALKKTHDRPGLEMLRGVPLPQLGPRDVLVSVTCAGVCGTDRHIYEWDAWSRGRVKLGVTVGHELVGQVAAVGPAVSRVNVGQRVSAEGHIGCGTCQACRTGNAHICDRVEILGIDRDGCFAQFVAVPEENIWPVHPDISDQLAAVMDPLGNAMHTVMAAGVSGRSILITGAGTIGLMAVLIARAAGATRVLVADVHPQRLDLAEKLGADVMLDARQDDWFQDARLHTQNRGPDVLLEMSGHPVAIEQGLRALRSGGTAAMLGLPSERVSLDLPRDVIFKGLTVLGINGRRMFETWYQVEAFLLAGHDLSPILTHELPLSDFRRAFDLVQRGEAIKAVLHIPPALGELAESSASSARRSATR